MTSKEAFTVAVRIAGLVAGMWSLGYFTSAALAYLDPQNSATRVLPWHYVFVALVMFLASLYLLRGAPLVVRWAYGREKTGNDGAS